METLVFLVIALLFTMPGFDFFSNWLNNLINFNTQVNTPTLSFNSFSNSTHMIFQESNRTSMFFTYSNGTNPFTFTYSNATSLGISFADDKASYKEGQMIMFTGTEKPITGKLDVSIYHNGVRELHFYPVYEDLNGNFVVLIETQGWQLGNYTVYAQSDNANQTSWFSVVSGVNP